MDPESALLIKKIEQEENIFTKARLLHHLKFDRDMTIKDMALALAMSSSLICSIIRLLKIPDIVTDGYYTKTISLTHLFILSRLKKEEDIIAAYETVLGKALTTAQTEELIRHYLHGITTTGDRLSEKDTSAIKKRFESIDRSINVTIIQTQKQSRVIIAIGGNLKKTTSALQQLIPADVENSAEKRP